MNPNFIFEPLPLTGLIKVRLKEFPDERGRFVELYKQSVFQEAGITEPFLQDNYSRSKKDVLRGLHYQKNPAGQTKLIRCLQGEIFDVAVDIRKSSSTYGKWVGVTLRGDEYSLLIVPVGFAHGFVVRSETADILYKCTSEYSPAHDRGLRWDDPELNIQWECANPIISAKDRDHPPLSQADNNFG